MKLTIDLALIQIINNFVGLDNDSTAPFPNAASAFDIYNAQANYDPKVEGQYYYDFRWVPYSLLMAQD